MPGRPSKKAASISNDRSDQGSMTHPPIKMRNHLNHIQPNEPQFVNQDAKRDCETKHRRAWVKDGQNLSATSCKFKSTKGRE